MFQYEFILIFLSRLKMINGVREEIESMDVNLVRYNFKNESNLFVKKILEYNVITDQKNLLKNENSAVIIILLER